MPVRSSAVVVSIKLGLIAVLDVLVRLQTELIKNNSIGALRPGKSNPAPPLPPPPRWSDNWLTAFARCPEDRSPRRRRPLFQDRFAQLFLLPRRSAPFPCLASRRAGQGNGPTPVRFLARFAHRAQAAADGPWEAVEMAGAPPKPDPRRCTQKRAPHGQRRFFVGQTGQEGTRWSRKIE